MSRGLRTRSSRIVIQLAIRNSKLAMVWPLKAEIRVLRLRSEKNGISADAPSAQIRVKVESSGGRNIVEIGRL
jgi:hypothetical protein